ncbi:60S acidic ribosomal protein P2 [Diplonema papillatum]|nr:60S acidic ribosomal protein P2 [Diplonema papillatum]KAJ9457143.1 60S acidic ribosomal protein P2 [Diplonema papillatum]
MRYIAAYLLAQAGGNDSPTEKDVKKIVTAVGGEVDADKLSDLFKQLEGKDIKELIAEGVKKLANVGGGGGGAAAAPAGGAAAAAPKEAAKAAEPEPESDEGMDDFGLFD